MLYYYVVLYVIACQKLGNFMKITHFNESRQIQCLVKENSGLLILHLWENHHIETEQNDNRNILYVADFLYRQNCGL